MYILENKYHLFIRIHASADKLIRLKMNEIETMSDERGNRCLSLCIKRRLKLEKRSNIVCAC